MIHSRTVKDVMTTQVTTFLPEMEVMEAVRIMVEQRISGAPVVDHDRKIVGMLTEKDCLKVVLNAGYYDDWGGRVDTFMNPIVVSVDADTNIVALAEKFIAGPYRRFPVVHHDQLVGQISRHDILRAILSLTS